MTQYLGDTALKIDSIIEATLGAGVSIPDLRDKGGQVYNVKGYGALGDGTTEDHVAIAAAITAASAAGGGTVYAPKGTYIIGAAIDLKANVNIVGDGWTTIFKSKNSLNTTPLRAQYLNLVTNITLKDFKLDMNGTNQSSSGWFAMTGVTNFTLDHVWFYNAKTFGTVIQADGDPLSGNLPKYGSIQNCRFDTQSDSSADFAIIQGHYLRIINNYFGDMHVGTSNYALSAGRSMRNCIIANNVFENNGSLAAIGLEDIQDVVISDNRIYDAGYHGIFVTTLSLTDNQRVTITGNVVSGCGYDGINLSKPLECIITGNICYNNGRDGISSNTTFNTIISDNICYNNNQGANASPTGSGIRLSGGSPSRVTIVGNQCFDSQVVKTQTYGIYSGNGDNQLVTNNIVHDNVNGQISVAGASTIIRSNPGITDSPSQTVANGGTGATTLSGVLKGNGTSAVTGSATLNDLAAPTADFSMASHKLTSVTDPSGAQDAATKNYVDGIATNLGKRARVRVATTGNITIATALNNADSIDGVALVTGDWVLVRGQSAPAENGVYVVGVTPARASEFDTYDEHPGSLIVVAEGSTYADTVWLSTSNSGGTLNTTAIAFSQTTATGALLASNNLSDITNAGTARSSLGLVIGTNVQAYDADLDTWATKTAPSGAVVGTTDTQTQTNKRITPRITTIVSSGTPTVNTDDCDAVTITAQAAAITSMTTNLTGAPTNFQKLIYRIKDDGTGRAITWGASFESKGVTLPATTVANKVLTVGFLYDTVALKWGCVASVSEA